MPKEAALAAQQNHQDHSSHKTPKASKRSQKSKVVNDIVRVKLDGSESLAVSGTKMDVVKDPNRCEFCVCPLLSKDFHESTNHSSPLSLPNLLRSSLFSSLFFLSTPLPSPFPPLPFHLLLLLLLPLLFPLLFSPPPPSSPPPSSPLRLFPSLLWTPAPPKLSLHPSTIQSHLFPEYQSPTPQGGGKGNKREEKGRTRAEKFQPR